ncbi:MAG: ROK family protein [Acidimicrobiia bacterium]
MVRQSLAGDNVEADSPGDLLNLIRSGRARTRGELGQVTGLARSTVTQRIDALKGAGLIVELGEAAPSTGGRPPSLLGFNADAGLVLAADLGATHSRVSVSNLLAEAMIDTTAEIDIDVGPIEVLSWLEKTFKQLLADLGRPMADVRGVGIGLPGPVDFAHGMAVNPPIMAGWHMFPVADHCREVFGVPVLVDNDVNIMALGEYWAMEPKVEDLIFVKVGTGIGSGLILGGRLHRGATGAAGDMGHVRTSDEALCRCGNNGCLEATAGGWAIAARLRDRGLDATGARDVVALVRQGNREATRSVRAAGRLIGQVLASTVNLLNPEMIVLGGDLAEAEPQLLAGIREVVYQRSTTLSTTDLKIGTSNLGDYAGVTGAAAMVIDQILDPAAIDHVLAGSRHG